MSFADRISRLAVLAACAVAASVAVPGSVRAQDGLKNIRLEGGAGIQGGDPDIEFAGVSDELDTGVGYAISGGIWFDKVGLEYLSLGVQYTRLDGADYSETVAATFLGGALAGTVEIAPSIDAVMVNAALRLDEGRVHPYVGGGVGVAFARAEIAANATVVVNGQTFTLAGSEDDSDVGFAGQIFGGVDFDLTDKVYDGVSGRYLLTDATLFDADVSFRNYMLLGVLGYRF